MIQFNYPLDQPIEGNWKIIVPVYGEDDLAYLRQFLDKCGFPSYEYMSTSLSKDGRMTDDNAVAIRLSCHSGKPWNKASSGWCDLLWYLAGIWGNSPVLQIYELFSQDGPHMDEVNMGSLMELI